MRKWILGLLLGVLGAVALGHDGHGSASAPSATAKVARPALATGAAEAPDGQLWVVGLDEAGRLFVQQTADLGATWSTPRQLDTGDDTVSADGENRPKIAFGRAGQVVISYTRPLAKLYTGEIRLLRSSDGGKHFSLPHTVHQDRQIITHRFESILFDRAGRLHVVWIDKRDLVSSGGKYRGAAIYRTVSDDAGEHFGPDRKLADYSCECCRIALAPAPDGGLVALWRHVFEPNIRDHAFAVLNDAPSAPVRATHDDWRLDACPHHGPGLASAASGGYHAVWFGEKAGRQGARYGRLDADGRPAGPVLELPDPRAEHADVISEGERLAIVWRSFDGQQTRLFAWLSNNDGRHFTQRELLASRESNDHPRLVAGKYGPLVVWRTTGKIHVLPLAF